MYRSIDVPFYAVPEQTILALVADSEARGEGVDGETAVMNVIKNRIAKGGWFLDSGLLNANLSQYHAVILKNAYVEKITKFIYQFSCFQEGDPNRERMLNMIPTIQGTWATIDMANKVISGETPDNTNGATYYANLSICDPAWAKTMKQVAVIGHHTFFC